MNCHMEEKESKGRAEKQAQNGGYEKEAYLHLLSVIFEGTKVEEKHGLSELQKKIPIHFICIYITMSDSAKRKNTFVHAQANNHQIHLVC